MSVFCSHIMHERFDAALAGDGLCPLCLLTEVEQLRQRISVLEDMLVEIDVAVPD